jgi:hypothetical protein
MHACLEAVSEHLYAVASRNTPASAGVAKLIQVVLLCNRTDLDGSWEPGKSKLRTFHANAVC